VAKSKEMKIDVYAHILPEKFKDALFRELPKDSYWRAAIGANPILFDISARFKVTDNFNDYLQVLTLANPPIELALGPDKSAELSAVANDSMADLVGKYPDKFAGAVACLPMNNVKAALKEIDRTVDSLGFKGIQVFSPTNDKPLDSPEFMPIYEKMAKYDLPVWIHPFRTESQPDYKTENVSMYRIYHRFGWPYETTAAMTRLVFSGVLEKYPGLKFITHHCGGMVPYFATRTEGRDDTPQNERAVLQKALSKPPSDYFKMFYGDTANVNVAALTCGYEFFGAGHLVFGTDAPFGAKLGEGFIRLAIETVEKLNISEKEKRDIFEGNARRLLNMD
jgi:uncharacterized protein